VRTCNTITTVTLHRPMILLFSTFLSGAILTACVKPTGSKGLPPEGGSLGATSASKTATLGAGGTNAPSLNGASTAKPRTYSGAGFQTPVFSPTTVPNSINGLPKGPTTIMVEKTNYGMVLAAPDGHTLYMRLGDTPTYPGCKATCSLAFPPVLTNGAPQASGGILAGYLGVLTSPTKGEQIAYAGHPLYTYSGDTAPGQLNAQGAGGIWFAITPTGGPLKAPAVTAKG
ncbi:unnamed protein product, partial [Acidithrix sp. C25]